MKNAIGGIVGIGLCVFGVIVLQSDDVDRNAGWVLLGIGGFFLLLWLLSLLARRGERIILEHGKMGSCEILSLSETGVFINERPQLNLHVRIWADDMEPQVSQIKRTIGHDMLGRLQPGAILPIRFAPSGGTNDWVFDSAAPAQQPATQPTSGSDIAGELERLTQLHQQGALSDEEFAKAKQRLLP